MIFSTLARASDSALLTQLTLASDEAGLTNVFNPSLVVSERSTLVAFRAERSRGVRPFHAFLLKVIDGTSVVIDLSAEGEQLGLAKTADPKLTILGDDVYATFNTGNVHTGQNEIYLRRVHPTLGPLQRCVLPRRRMVEKNWGFYLNPDGGLHALYSLAPLATMRLTSGALGDSDELHFELDRIEDVRKRFPRLHIGSQPVMLNGTRALVVANQQRPIPGLPRKIYFGRLAEVDFATRSVTLSRRGLIHSWASMLPSRERHNPGLFSATYFSGLSRDGDDFILSYGVNDLSSGVARVSRSDLW